MDSAPTADQTLHHQVRGQGAPLLFVHGTGGDGDAFAGASALLSRTRRVILYDRRGFSRSSTRPHARRDYYRRHADDAARLLDSLQIERAAVCGWSAGGLVALELAVTHPDRVAQLVLYEPPFHASRQLSPGAMVSFARALLWRAVGNKRRAAGAFFASALGRDWTRMPDSARDKLLANADGVLHELDGGTGTALDAARLATIRCPVTVLLGGDSPRFFAACADRLSRLAPRIAVIRVPGGGHGMPVLQPLAFADAVDRTLRSNPG